MPPKRGRDDDRAVGKHLKVFVGGLSANANDHHVGSHFVKYGQVVQCNVFQPKDAETKKAPYAFITFKYAADADCAVVDTQHFPGASRQLKMGFASPKRKDKEEEDKRKDILSENDPCKVFVGGICDRDEESEIGDFFSQWGLVALVYRDKSNWGFVHFATREGAVRLLEEGSVVFQRRRLDVKASGSKRVMDESEREDLIRRAITRHFHKKTMMGPPPAMLALPGPPGAPGGYPPPSGYYGGAPPPGYYGGGAPPGYPPSSYPPPSYPPSGYPPSGPPGYPPSSGYPPQSGPPPAIADRGPPPPSGAGDYRGPPPSGGGPDPYASSGHHRGSDPYSGSYPPPGGAPPPGGGPPPDYGRGPPPSGGDARDPYNGYYRDNRGERPREALADRPREDYYRAGGYDDRSKEPRRDYYQQSGDPYYRSGSSAPPAAGPYGAPPPDAGGPPPHGGPPRGDPYARAPPPSDYRHDPRYAPY